ncbi:hypothetical protein TREMEDRAFT_67629 [Tremella mesenterica DSM 1558]|uniref:uncharacterized protein n=1 Tax=Tremella mesenterica (strain ATCC 24925 / CBS 8224 / DSM 1558 / NBRC 9311 / NRRL Y-6157 / RJB 2259-6 / UBC 559-6) TaxID=578456 RepID=UPI0003F49847|nr:uncharacterized protein TREMEDRAFT_67629 [Tremella mesenterica DSM 1558]EIW71225.1 hypothetical protein TREMEDRAFT_67629 [Tremella mesenterica DSM 1558]
MSQDSGPSTWHTVTLKIPFYTSQHAQIAKKVLQVDKEQNAQLVERQLEVEENILVVTYKTATVRLLRLATNSFLSSAELISRAMSEFAPDPTLPRVTDDELERIRLEANKGNSGGIELRGDGVGAGSGQEVT